MGEDRLNEALHGGPSGAKATRKAPSRGYTMSVYIGPERKARIERLQQDWGLNASEAIRLLLDHALSEVDKGRLTPETETITKAKAPAP
jgi:hypothetical protein